jgi:hypothetical protein
MDILPDYEIWDAIHENSEFCEQETTDCNQSKGS